MSCIRKAFFSNHSSELVSHICGSCCHYCLWSWTGMRGTRITLSEAPLPPCKHRRLSQVACCAGTHLQGHTSQRELNVCHHQERPSEPLPRRKWRREESSPREGQSFWGKSGKHWASGSGKQPKMKHVDPGVTIFSLEIGAYHVALWWSEAGS